MAIRKLGKAAAALALVVGLTAAMAGQASAAPDADDVVWNHVRGLDSIRECEAGEAPYLHWILTPGGGSTATSPILHIGGATYSVGKTTPGALHFYTGSDVDLSLDVYASQTAGSFGRNALLTISDGCTGEEEPPS